MSDPFTYFEMPEPYADMAFVDNLAGRTYLEDEGKAARFRHAYDDLHQSALSHRESIKLIKHVLKEIQ